MQSATGQGKASQPGEEGTVEGGEEKRAAATARSKAARWVGILDVVGAGGRSVKGGRQPVIKK